ncbi:MAG: relaxase domain-containing protein, partial [Acidimicrobiales bacterium]
PGGARDPHLGTRLVATRRPGMELVVSAHKSVAVLGIIGRAEDMHAILDAETDATLAHLEAWFVRQGGRRGKAQRRAPTEDLLWARTRHATSRAGDPCPHDHVLANVTEMLDDAGGWKSLDTGALRDECHAATMAGRLAAAAVAVERGYAIDADAGQSGKLDHWAIAGIPAVVTEAFSKRSDEIDTALGGGRLRLLPGPWYRGAGQPGGQGPRGRGVPAGPVAGRAGGRRMAGEEAVRAPAPCFRARARALAAAQ